jgi:hypothetical protein
MAQQGGDYCVCPEAVARCAVVFRDGMAASSTEEQRRERGRPDARASLHAIAFVRAALPVRSASTPEDGAWENSRPQCGEDLAARENRRS